MGWLGWTEEQALKTDINSIMVAMEGRLEMMFPEIKKQNAQKRDFATSFKAFVRDNNARFQ